ncbi:ribonuclease P protein component [Dysgonomonas sp. 216]|uniref:ribonuclease P protein component n=1 Tax=Dysgonomonas sp. 216 TaxID=2302934 RepID=UPI0013D7964F|nr:ribonuclease P protein component [Dysgonomonas sp. 216]NDW19621.1 ribonuclease P protein component [Dysgonomonas sp. 216]
MTLSVKNTLPKSERMSHTKSIDKLFSSGEAFISYPLRIVYCKREPDSLPLVSIMVSVPKKRFKRAVKRNRVKRLVREAYRLNKSLFWELCEKHNTAIDIVFICLKDELPDYKEIEKAILKTATTLDSRLGAGIEK